METCLIVWNSGQCKVYAVDKGRVRIHAFCIPFQHPLISWRHYVTNVLQRRTYFPPLKSHTVLNIWRNPGDRLESDARERPPLVRYYVAIIRNVNLTANECKSHCQWMLMYKALGCYKRGHSSTGQLPWLSLAAFYAACAAFKIHGHNTCIHCNRLFN